MIQKCIIHVTYQVTWILWGCSFLAPKKRSQKMIGILGSDTTKDGNPLCFFVVVGSAYAVESNHRDVGERCLETKRWRFRKLWISSFTFVIAIHLSSFIIIHHSLPCSWRQIPRPPWWLSGSFQACPFPRKGRVCGQEIVFFKVSTPLSDTLSRKVDAKQKVAKKYDLSQSHIYC